MRILLFLIFLTSCVSAEFVDTAPFVEADAEGVQNNLTDAVFDNHGVDLESFIPDNSFVPTDISFDMPTLSGYSGSVVNVSLSILPDVGTPLDNLRIVGRLFLLLTFTLYILGSVWQVIRQY